MEQATQSLDPGQLYLVEAFAMFVEAWRPDRLVSEHLRQVLARVVQGLAAVDAAEQAAVEDHERTLAEHKRVWAETKQELADQQAAHQRIRQELQELLQDLKTPPVIRKAIPA